MSANDCGSEHVLCPDGDTCCELGDTCCPDPGTNTGTGCCDISNVGIINIAFCHECYHLQGVCCDGYCCFDGFVCQDGGCGVGDSKNGTHSVWSPGVPIVQGSRLPP